MKRILLGLSIFLFFFTFKPNFIYSQQYVGTFHLDYYYNNITKFKEFNKLNENINSIGASFEIEFSEHNIFFVFNANLLASPKISFKKSNLSNQVSVLMGFGKNFNKGKRIQFPIYFSYTSSDYTYNDIDKYGLGLVSIVPGLRFYITNNIAITSKLSLSYVSLKEINDKKTEQKISGYGSWISFGLSYSFFKN